MRKKFYLIATLVLAGLQVGNAQVSHATKNPLLTRTVSLSALPTISLQEVGDVNVTVPTGWEHKTSDGTVTQATVTYDKKGRYKTVDYGNYKEEYSYVESANGEWAEMTMNRVEGSTTTPQLKKSRTYDSQGRIATEKIYEPNGDGLTLRSSYAYAYTANNEAKVVENFSYNGNECNGSSYIYFAPTQEYLENRYSDYEIIETTISGNSYTTTQKHKIDGVWQPLQTYTHFYTADGKSLGFQAIYYNDGVFSSANGEKDEFILDSPSNGSTTKITYKFSANDTGSNLSDYSWKYCNKVVYTNNFDDPYIPDGKTRTKIGYSYDESNQDWIEDSKDVLEWVGDGHLLRQYSYWYSKGQKREETSYTYYSSTGEEIGEGKFFDDGSYVTEEFWERKENGCDVTIYTYFNERGVEIGKYKELFDDRPYTCNPPKFYVWSDTGWVLATNSIQFGNPNNYQMICHIDNQGRPTEMIEYRDGSLHEHNKYEYTANGYTIKSYDPNGDGTEYVSEEESYSIDSNGTYEGIDFEYGSFGSIKYANKEKLYANGIHEEYTWDFGGNSFVLIRTNVDNLVSESNGVRTEIERDVDNGKVVEKAKTITTTTDRESIVEHYTKDYDGEWVGEYKKVETIPSAPSFSCISPSDPMSLYNNQYDATFHYATIANKPVAVTLSSNDGEDDEVDIAKNYTSYTWDFNEKAWNLATEYSTNSEVYGNTLINTTKRIEDNGNYIELQIASTTRDDNNRLIESTSKYTVTIYGEEQRNQSSTIKYTYDDNGNLLSRIYTDNNGNTESYTYKYGSIIVNEIESISIDKSQVQVTGNTISVSGCSNIALYSINGAEIGKSTSGSITAPAKGLYILKAGKSNVKVLVK